MKILFVGESWLGSCARSLKESLERLEEIKIDQVNEDMYFSKKNTVFRRITNRILSSYFLMKFERKVLSKVDNIKPDVVICYKGYHVHKKLIEKLKAKKCFVVNVYPDLSPHNHGKRHKIAVGGYDLVISTKVFHPEHWKSIYGYSNECIFIPQGYDPELHLINSPPEKYIYDLALVATYRQEYDDLLQELASLMNNEPISVIIGGNGWSAVKKHYPSSWRFVGAVGGKTYLNTLRSARICIAPLTTKMVVNSESQPGEVDTTRTYELAAAYCFFIHRRTNYLQSLYNEETEVPMFDDAKELANHIKFYINREKVRLQMAASAHNRAVPAYSIDARSKMIASVLRNKIAEKK